MELFKLLELMDERDMHVDFFAGKKKIFKVSAKSKNINIEIVDADEFKKIIKEIKK